MAIIIGTGEMRSKGTLLVNTPVQNTSGGYVDNYSSVCTFRGRFLQKNSSRQNEQGQLVNNKMFEFVTRAQNAFTQIGAAHRMQIDGKSYSILSFEEVDQIKHWYIFKLAVNA